MVSENRRSSIYASSPSQHNQLLSLPLHIGQGLDHEDQAHMHRQFVHLIKPFTSAMAVSQPHVRSQCPVPTSL